MDKPTKNRDHSTKTGKMEQLNRPSNKPLITLSRVTIRMRDQRLFDDDCWTIDINQHWAVVGPNGAGKTALVGAIAGFVPVVAGNIYYHDPKISPPNIGFFWVSDMAMTFPSF